MLGGFAAGKLCNVWYTLGKYLPIHLCAALVAEPTHTPMTIIFTGTTNLTIDSSAVILQMGDTMTATGTAVVGSGTALEQAAGRSITSGNMNPMRWTPRSHLLLQTLNSVTFGWIAFSTAAGAQTALTAINAAAAVPDDAVTIVVA